MQLTSENVDNVFRDCLFDDADIDTPEKRNAALESAVKVEGVVRNIGFNPERLKAHTSDIESLLEQLPDSFKKDGGGGMSFANIVETKDGVQWTSFHRNADQLVCLGLAIKKLKYCVPREMWDALPSGLPYIQIN